MDCVHIFTDFMDYVHIFTDFMDCVHIFTNFMDYVHISIDFMFCIYISALVILLCAFAVEHQFDLISKLGSAHAVQQEVDGMVDLNYEVGYFIHINIVSS